MIAHSTVGAALSVHGVASLLARPIRQRTRRMADRGFAPGLPHAVLVPLLEVACGALLGRAGVVGTAAAAAATALGAVRVAVDVEDGTVTAGTAAATGLTVAGLTAAVRSTRPRGRVGLVAAIGAVVVFELVRRRHVLRSH